MAWIDLTMTLRHEMPVYPNDPPMELIAAANISTDGFRNSILKTGMHTGTHIDGPLHLLNSGDTIDTVDLDCFCGKTVVIDAKGQLLVELDASIKNMDIENKIVLICTGYSANIEHNDYHTAHPILSMELAQYFVEKKVKAVGIDFPSPDKAPYLVHICLLSNGIFIIENLTNLEMLLNKEQIELFAFPIKTVTDSAPARVAARV
jgi:kynurenine formamidase